MKINTLAPAMIIAFVLQNAYAEDAEPQQICTTYIEGGIWMYRDYEWTLSLTPSACGRMVNQENTAHMFYEIAKKFGGSPYWRNTRGIINQLTCHLAGARDKPQWNLEPWRPYVGHNATAAALCNHEVPDPDSVFH